MRLAALILAGLLAAAAPAALAAPAPTPKPPSALLNEFRTCTAQGLGPGCITPNEVGDVVETMMGRTPQSAIEFGADPTGVSDSTIAVQGCITASVPPGAPCYLPPGTYKVTAPLSCPDRCVVIGEEINTWDYFNRSWFNNTVLAASGTWTANTAVFTLGNYNFLRGFTVHGLAEAGPGNDQGVDCFKGPDKLYDVLFGVYAISCRDGFNFAPASTNTQGLEIHFSRATHNTRYGFDFASTGAGAFSDNKITHSSSSSNYQGEINIVQGYSDQILDNRFESCNGPWGIQIDGGSAIAFTGNAVVNCPIALKVVSFNNGSNGAGSLAVTGNLFQSLTGTTVEDIDFAGNSSNIVFAGNSYTATGQYIFNVESGGTVTGAIYDRPNTGSVGLYDGALSGSQIVPITVQPPPSGNLGPGYPTFGSGWTANGSTTAGGVAGDPTGFSNAFRITEDASTGNSHLVKTTSTVSVTAGSTNTIETLVKVGSSGTRDLLFFLADGPGSNAIFAIYNPASGAYLTSGVFSGSGTITGLGCVPAFASGWFKCWLSGIIGGGVTAIQGQIGLATSGGSAIYNGDGTSNLIFYGPSLTPGPQVP